MPFSIFTWLIQSVTCLVLSFVRAQSTENVNSCKVSKIISSLDTVRLDEDDMFMTGDSFWWLESDQLNPIKHPKCNILNAKLISWTKKKKSPFLILSNS